MLSVKLTDVSVKVEPPSVLTPRLTTVASPGQEKADHSTVTEPETVNSGDCNENATGTYTYEAEFEFDLSDENEAKLTGTHFSQILGMPGPEELAEPPKQSNDIHMPGIGEE